MINDIEVKTLVKNILKKDNITTEIETAYTLIKNLVMKEYGNLFEIKNITINLSPLPPLLFVNRDYFPLVSAE
ncbi:MAG: hypothetical protein NC925_01770, partial [Candidatus Omnitrophica bacterium]|nr:hypothetical protein [Candidatus Omnitrophota bacterium]